MAKPVSMLRPNKKLLIISSIMLAIWIGVLVWIYVQWVWPSRQNGGGTQIEKTG